MLDISYILHTYVWACVSIETEMESRPRDLELGEGREHTAAVDGHGLGC